MDEVGQKMENDEGAVFLMNQFLKLVSPQSDVIKADFSPLVPKPKVNNMIED